MRKLLFPSIGLLLFFAFAFNVKADTYISSLFVNLNDGSPITDEQTIRVSLWNDGRWEADDVNAGVINTSAPHYAGYQAELTATPNGSGNLSLPFGNFEGFPEITPLNQFLMLEYKDSGDPITAYAVYKAMILNGTTLDRLPLVQNGTTMFQEEYTNHATDADVFTLDKNNDASTEVTLQFGETLAETLTWDTANTRFVFSDDVRVEGNMAAVGQAYIATDHDGTNSSGTVNIGKNSSAWETLSWNTGTLRFDLSDDLNVGGGVEVNGNVDLNLNQAVEMRLENLSSAPTCNSESEGRTFYNTTDDQTYVCNGSAFVTVGGSTPIHYHNGSVVSNTKTATVSGLDTTGENTVIYLTSNGASNGTILFSNVYHVSITASEIQSLAEAPIVAGYSYNAGTGALTVKFLESATVVLASQGLEAEEAGTPFTAFVVGN